MVVGRSRRRAGGKGTVPAPVVASHRRLGLPVSVLTLLNLGAPGEKRKAQRSKGRLRFGKQLKCQFLGSRRQLPVPKTTVSLGLLLVYLAPMPHMKHEDNQLVIIEVVDHAVVADSNPHFA